MSAIKDGGYTVELKGKEYRLLFTLNALDEIQTKFGGYDKLDEVFNQNNPDWVKDTKWLLTMLINEGLLDLWTLTIPRPRSIPAYPVCSPGLFEIWMWVWLISS